jgi:elongator complex protein 1
MRKHRIDLNFLYDHNPQQFMESIELFVKQINSVDNLNLFMSSLKNENVTETGPASVALIYLSRVFTIGLS